jgi:histone deacetylase 1/2
MENANSREYLEKIKIQVIENLKKTAHAPSVQMTDVPRATLSGDLDLSDYDDELDDLEEDELPDERVTMRMLDQRIARDDELDDSDGEEGQLNGARSRNGVNKRRNIMDYQNPNAVAPDIEVEDEIATPEVVNDVDEKAAALPKEEVVDVNDTTMEENSEIVTGAEADEVAPSSIILQSHSAEPAVDNDGDVEMEQAAPEPAAQVPTPSPEPQSPLAAPAPTSVPATAEATPLSQDSVEAKQEGEAERQDADVSGEAATEIAQQSQP